MNHSLVNERAQPLLLRDPRPRRPRRRRRARPAAAWPSAAACSTGPARASTTSSRSGSPSSATSTRARSRARRASAPSTRSPTRAGRRSRDYARTPVTFTPLKSEPLLRLLICDLVGEEVTRESLATLRDDIADLAARLDDVRGRAPRRCPTARSTCCSCTSFLRRLLDLHQQLVDEVERELDTRASVQLERRLAS